MVRCQECGRHVKSYFEHVDVNCNAEGYSKGWEDYEAGGKLFAGMRSYAADDPTLTDYITGWHGADAAYVAAVEERRGVNF